MKQSKWSSWQDFLDWYQDVGEKSIKQNKCLTCGEKLKQVEGEKYCWYCPCTPGIITCRG